MSNQQVKGSGCGTREWREDFVLTDTDQSTALFKVDTSGNMTVAGTSTFTGVLKAPDGTAAAPGVTFSADTDNGMYRIGTNNVGVAAAGAKVLDVSATGLGVTGTTLSGDGTVALPGLGFSADTDCGLYRIGTNNMGAAVNGAKVLDVGTAGLGVTGTLISSGAVTAQAGLAVIGASTFAGAAGVTASAAGSLSRNLTPATTSAAATKQALQTYAVPAALLASTGQGVKVRAWGTVAANGNTKTMTLEFGATVVATSGAITGSGVSWHLEAEVYRTGATAQSAIGKAMQGVTNIAPLSSTPAETLANSINMIMYGTNGSASADITCNGMVVELIS